MNLLETIMTRVSDFGTPEPVREQLVKELIQYPCKEVTGVLAKTAVVDISPRVRRTAVRALKEINPEEALAIFIRNLNHQNPKIIVNVIHALEDVGYINRNRAIQALSQLRNNLNYKVRVIATRAVQRLAGVRQTGPRNKPRLEIVTPAPAFL